MNRYFLPYDLSLKLKEKGFNVPFFFYYRSDDDNKHIHHANITNPLVYSDKIDDEVVIAASFLQVFEWFRREKNIDVEIHAVTDMLGNKAYSPYICTYTTFKLDDDDEVVRYRQKKFNTLKPLPHEIIPAHSNFLEWEEAACDAIKYVIENLI